MRKGDVLIVWKLDRLLRSLRDVLTIMERIQEAKAGFCSLTEAIDTTTPAGRMMMQMIGSFADFERAMLRERTRAGLESARSEGRIGGRRPKLLPQQRTEVVRMVKQGKETAADAARLFNVHARIGQALLTAKEQGGDPFAAIEKIVSWVDFARTVTEAEQLAQPEDFDFLGLISNGFPQMRRYTPAMLDIFDFRAAPAARQLLEVVDLLRSMNRDRTRTVPQNAPLEWISQD